MDNNLNFLISFVLGLLAYSLIAKWYVLPAVRSRTRAEALSPILLLHSFRYVGLVFLVTGVVSSDLPAAFARPAAYGDLVAAILAFVALWGLHSGGPLGIPLAWIFNIVGTLDLFYAVFRGTQLGVGPQLGGAYFIPVLVVPALLVSHFLVFQILLRRN